MKGGCPGGLTAGVIIQITCSLLEATNMQIKRLVNDKAVVKGDQLFDSKGEAFKFKEFSGGQLTTVSSTNETISKTAAELGCYLLDKNRTETGLNKDRLRSFWED